MRAGALPAPDAYLPGLVWNLSWNEPGTREGPIISLWGTQEKTYPRWHIKEELERLRAWLKWQTTCLASTRACIQPPVLLGEKIKEEFKPLTNSQFPFVIGTSHIPFFIRAFDFIQSSTSLHDMRLYVRKVMRLLQLVLLDQQLK
jgi:hypothetical protein